MRVSQFRDEEASATQAQLFPNGDPDSKKAVDSPDLVWFFGRRLPGNTQSYVNWVGEDQVLSNHEPPSHFGGVVFNSAGMVLLVEPQDHFGGYAWTFPKITASMTESPSQAASRAVEKKTGITPRIVVGLEESFSGSPDGGTSCYFVMVDAGDRTLVPGIQPRGRCR